MSKEGIIDELLKPVRKKFPRKKIKILGLDDMFQADLAVLTNLERYNRGYKYLLVVINSFSKFLFCEPLKSKSSLEVAQAFEKILKRSKYLPNLLCTDRGTEFYSSHFKAVCRKYGIHLYSTTTTVKSSLAENGILLLRRFLGKQFLLNRSKNWVDQLDKVLEIYNNRKHTKTKIAPIKITRKNEKQILKTVYEKDKPIFTKPKYKIGQFCRLAIRKNLFYKSHEINWTPEVFKIVAVNNKYPTTYKVESLDGAPIIGQFYDSEISLTKFPNEFLVEKIVRRKGSKVLVKWLGFPSELNSWEEENTLEL